METLKNILWLLVVFFPLIIILIVGVLNFIRKERLVEILVKSAIAFFLYLSVTITVFITILIIAFSSRDFELKNLVGFLLIFGYPCFGLFLYWFVRRDLGDTLSLIIGKPEKMPTLLSK